MKPSRSTRVQDNTCFAGDDLILFVSTRQTTLDYFYVLNRHIGFGITVLKMTNLDIFGSSRWFFYWDILLYPVTARWSLEWARLSLDTQRYFFVDFWNVLVTIRLIEWFIMRNSCYLELQNMIRNWECCDQCLEYLYWVPSRLCK